MAVENFFRGKKLHYLPGAVPWKKTNNSNVINCQDL